MWTVEEDSENGFSLLKDGKMRYSFVIDNGDECFNQTIKKKDRAIASILVKALNDAKA